MHNYLIIKTSKALFNIPNRGNDQMCDVFIFLKCFQCFLKLIFWNKMIQKDILLKTAALILVFPISTVKIIISILFSSEGNDF
jgi:hypothetical protein